MLISTRDLGRIRDGRITLAFRRWRRPSVRSGSSLLTALGELSIRDVRVVSLDQISDTEAKRAGFESRKALFSELNRRSDGQVYRIEFGTFQSDARIALRESPVSKGELEELLTRLAKLDARSDSGAWTTATLEVLDSNPSVPARELCELLGQEREPFKRDVRKLKTLGLTESLETGYRLSVRGESLLRHIRSQSGADV
jgi:hypothetical protein